MTIFQLQWIGYLLGLSLIGIGIVLSAWAVLETGTTNIESPDRLLTSGPYSFSRNPMYVGWGSLYLGVALIVNSVWIIALFPLVFAVTHFLDVIKEEQFLGEQFGEEYRDYQSRVRRYL
ncbi:MAG: isoprenylcysteine carboxylmethyltransferase family protein [Chloroflexota bacterium]|nr:MAG: isoprenylcysteine carboxylmethyltransferase family protein [Chloroflexota bacterium]